MSKNDWTDDEWFALQRISKRQRRFSARMQRVIDETREEIRNAFKVAPIYVAKLKDR
jgi:hypothetical protein